MRVILSLDLMHQGFQVGQSMLKNTAGFTLIELIITMAVLAVVATVAVPGFGNLIEGNRMVSNSNLVISSIRLARSEALRRGEAVTFSTDGGMASGWCVHRGDANIDCDEDANLIRRFESPGGLTFGVTANDLTFDRRGFLSPQLAQSITIRPDNCPAGRERSTTINISPVGRTEITNGVCP